MNGYLLKNEFAGPEISELISISTASHPHHARTED